MRGELLNPKAFVIFRAMSTRTLSVIVPALNEERNLAAAVNIIRSVVPSYFSDWEILVFNDGSTDKTGQIADQLHAEDPRIRVTHHSTPHNLGGCYKSGVRQATKEFAILVPGDNEYAAETLAQIFAVTARVDMIIPYTTNAHVRPLGRRLLSGAFVGFMNFLSGYKLRYYNGTVLLRTELARNLDIRTDSFGYMAEALVKLLQQGNTYFEVPVQIHYREHGSSKALRPSNLFAVFVFILRLIKDTAGESVKKLAPARGYAAESQ